jgi:glycosyltransferase involved in cell wall biosynthesis
MRVLHLFANYKWTGPADPAIRLAAAQRQAGADVLFALPGWHHPGAEERVRRELLRRNLPVAAGLRLRKHLHPGDLVRDARELGTRVRMGEFDLLHCHLPGDHLLAVLARRFARRRVPIVRSLYDPQPPVALPRALLSFSRSAGVVAPTEACAEATRRRFGLRRERVLAAPPPVESAVFTPRGSGADLREHWGLRPEHFAVGIVARIQAHRRFELLWEVAAEVVRAHPGARFLLLGRGDQADVEQLCFQPVDQLGLTRQVLFPGYRYEAAFPPALRALDAFLFLVPGSDGTCRAVREAFATGLPVVSSDLGILPELVGAGERGVAVPLAKTQLAAALLHLARSPELRARMGGQARAYAVDALDPQRHARAVLALYHRLREAGA